jgi:hypothetical protein
VIVVERGCKVKAFKKEPGVVAANDRLHPFISLKRLVFSV